jgi:hypothetical protein
VPVEHTTKPDLLLAFDGNSEHRLLVEKMVLDEVV